MSMNLQRNTLFAGFYLVFCISVHECFCSSIFFPCTMFKWFLYQCQTCFIKKKKKCEKALLPIPCSRTGVSTFFSMMGIVNGSKYLRQCGPYYLCVATTVVLQCLQGTGFRIPTETRIQGCSSPLYKMAQYLHITCTYPPLYFKLSLGYL